MALLCFVLTVLASRPSRRAGLRQRTRRSGIKLIVLRRKVQGRVRLTNNDRLFFVHLYRVGSQCHQRERDVQFCPLRVMIRAPAASRGTIILKPSCLISCSQLPPGGGKLRADGRHGSMKPAGRGPRRERNDIAA